MAPVEYSRRYVLRRGSQSGIAKIWRTRNFQLGPRLAVHWSRLDFTKVRKALRVRITMDGKSRYVDNVFSNSCGAR